MNLLITVACHHQAWGSIRNILYDNHGASFVVLYKEMIYIVLATCSYQLS